MTLNVASGQGDAVAAPQESENLRTVPLRHYPQHVAALIVLVVLAWLVSELATNPNMQWSQVVHFLTSPIILQGVLTTIQLTVMCMILGTFLGLVFAVMRMSDNRFLRTVSWYYVWFFRGTPVLVQLIFWYNLSLLFPRIGIGIPFTDIGVGAPTNSVVSPLLASILGLGLNVGAYMAEIVRGGILAIDRGQSEAAAALGMTRKRIMRRIVLPQAMRVILPPTGNQFIDLLKASSMVAFIAGGDLLTRTQQVYAMNFQVVPLLVVASIWYLVLTSIATFGQYFIERHYGRGEATRQARTLGAQLRRNLKPWRISKGNR
ncbi:amino acid ABC transporter permease [Nonomuraea deserti]|uniref:Amino acid ABC transporter permease n=1 Tax=Nonomuraea deserti TaxID=1848322 RepID=A0A4R4UUG5_9ACTN|nr:amino acid ABC transporter permease [Nonomuraea deserti]TDC96108.1 amino acid ABC transporter permease [Nonomuraea deserti]